LENQLALFRSGGRVDPAMQVVAVHSTVGDLHDIVALAGYLSGLDSNPHPVNGSGEHLISRLGNSDVLLGSNRPIADGR
jgi:hypothetical protein